MVKTSERIYEDFEVNCVLKGSSRKELRDAVVRTFLEEKGGYWKNGIKQVTKYKYFVETLSDGKKIFLLRPTFLNKGIDFQVWVERFENEEDKKPSHKDIFKDLKIKQKENPKLLEKLLDAIDSVWYCEEPEVVLKRIGKIEFKNGFSTEMLLKILKWLFIEQDVTYWNYDGRGMLRMEINKQLDISDLSDKMKEFFK